MKVFMISYGAGHCNVIAPVYKKLVQKKENEVTYLALTMAPVHLKGRNVQYAVLSEIARKLPYYERVSALGRKYGMAFHNEASGIEIEDTVAYYGIGMYDLIKQHGEKKAESIFRKQGRKAFLPVETMCRILNDICPDVCVVTAAPRMEEATGIAAEKLKIPVVLINDMPDFLPWFYPIKYKCSVCVMNDWAKKFAVDVAKVPSADVYVTGQPALEESLKVDMIYLKRIKREIGLDKFSKMVTFFAQPGKDQSLEISTLFAIAEKMKDVLFVLKLHPNQEIDAYADPLQNNVYITRDDNKALYYLSDVAITENSTTGMEAFLAGTPLIVVNFNHIKYVTDYVAMGIAVMCDDEKTLEEMIGALLNHESAEYGKALESRGSFDNTENAAENICNVINIKGLSKN